MKGLSRGFFVRATALFAGGSLLALGCNWGRFKKLEKDAPVVRLSPPEFYDSGYGYQVAAVRSEETATLLVGGPAWSRGGVSYSIGLSENPETYPFDSSHCPLDDSGVVCRGAAQTAGLNRSWAPNDKGPYDLCFVSGAAQIGSEFGLFTRCQDGKQFLLALPEDIDPQDLMRPDEDDPRGLRLATNREGPQVLLASSPSLGWAWFYPPLSNDPQLLPELDPPPVGDTIAVARTDENHLLFLSAPRAGRVWVFSVQEDELLPLGCIEGPEGLGRALTTGDVDGDGVEDLAIGAERNVSVLSGALLSGADYPSGGDCLRGDEWEDLRIYRVNCSAEPGLGGCGGSDYAESLAIADLEGDGYGFLAVGAPKMKVDGAAQAGAVLVYDPEGELRDVIFPSDVGEEDLFGSSLVPVAQSNREIFAASARNARHAYLFYCSGLSDRSLGSRCH